MDSILRIADLVIAEDKWQREPKTFSNTIIPNDLIHNLVFFFCSPGSLLCLSRTCSSVHTMVQAYMQRVFKIERILSRFFTSPISFRRIQAETGTLISGSTILQFFNRSFYPKSDLDLYVSWISDYFMIADFLSKEGYKYVPRPGQHAVFNVAAGEDAFDRPDSAYEDVDEVLHVFTWKKYPEGRLEDALRIQLIVSTDDPINVILGFHSTCVMNFASFEKAYSLYPKATFEKRTSLMCRSKESEGSSSAYEKYRNRGWSIQEEFPLPDMKTDYHLNQQSYRRRVGDKHCWIISFSVPQGFTHTEDSYIIEEKKWRTSSLIHNNISPETRKLCSALTSPRSQWA